MSFVSWCVSDALLFVWFGNLTTNLYANNLSQVSLSVVKTLTLLTLLVTKNRFCKSAGSYATSPRQGQNDSILIFHGRKVSDYG